MLRNQQLQIFKLQYKAVDGSVGGVAEILFHLLELIIPIGRENKVTLFLGNFAVPHRLDEDFNHRIILRFYHIGFSLSNNGIISISFLI